MSVRKRTWRNRDGTRGEAWVANYTDRNGARRLKSFDRMRDAKAFEAAVTAAVTDEPMAKLARSLRDLLDPQEIRELCALLRQSDRE
jgi:hypothetical protein